ncbi:hypothetical protein RQP46_003126 [Phenoliferia psychrophenolica]
MGKKKPVCYGVRYGRIPGVYMTWEETKAQTEGFSGARQEGFQTVAEAERFVAAGAVPEVDKITNYGTRASGTGAGKATHARDDDDGGEPDTVKRAKQSTSTRPADSVFDKNGPDRTVFTDGSSLGNGQVGSSAGIGVCWARSPTAPGGRNLSERLPGSLQTNNRAEMFAFARVLETDSNPELPLTICTDSTYTINVFSEWAYQWRSNNWKTGSGKPAENRDMIEYILALIALRMPANSTSNETPTGNITFEKVLAHSGIDENEQADQLAKAGATLPVVEDRDWAKDSKELEEKLRAKGIVKREPGRA